MQSSLWQIVKSPKASAALSGFQIIMIYEVTTLSEDAFNCVQNTAGRPVNWSMFSK